MRWLVAILLICATSAIRAEEETNAVLPSVSLSPITLDPVLLIVQQMAVVETPGVDVAEKADAFRAAVEWAGKLGKLRNLSPNGHSWVYFQLREIEELAETDKPAAEAVLIQTLETLRGWGAEL